jgi:2-polyprenyl-3-methyl-5-hydroxy-6-metoxy-1,4-benzoquinol methylase
MRMAEIVDAEATLSFEGNSPAEFVWTPEGQGHFQEYLIPSLHALLPTRRKLSIIDAGCGNGIMTAHMARMGHTVQGFDLSTTGIALSKKAFPHVPFHLKSVYEDYRTLVSEVDAVTSFEVIEHLTRPLDMLLRAHEVLKPGGLLILSTPYHGYLKNLALSLFDGWDKHFESHRDCGHIKFFSQRTLTALLTQAGFTDFTFANAGRTWGLWKSMVVRAVKPLR